MRNMHRFCHNRSFTRHMPEGNNQHTFKPQCPDGVGHGSLYILRFRRLGYFIRHYGHNGRWFPYPVHSRYRNPLIPLSARIGHTDSKITTAKPPPPTHECVRITCRLYRHREATVSSVVITRYFFICRAYDSTGIKTNVGGQELPLSVTLRIS